MEKLVQCPICETLKYLDEYNFEVDECKECHTQSNVSYDECGCEDCLDLAIAKIDFTDYGD